MGKALKIALACLALAACQPRASAPTTPAQVELSAVKFTLNLNGDENELFRRELIHRLTQVQVRGEAAGLYLEVASSPNYEMYIVGGCEGAIAAARPLVIEAARSMPNAKVVQEGFERRASCSKFDEGPRAPIFIGASGKPG